MLRVLIFLVSLGARAMCQRRAELVMENLVLRQQVTALKKERPRPSLDDTDRGFWVALRSSWPGELRFPLRLPNEKIQWGKIGVDTPNFIIESNATIVAPLMFAWILGW